MSLLPLGHNASSSEVYCESLDKPVTKVYQNRPAWVAGSRSHFMSNFARQSPTLALVSTFGVVLMAASGIVTTLGGSRYGGTSNVAPCTHPMHSPRGAWGDARRPGTGTSASG
eukprot:COSAG02_NODE_441_length_22281_cov_6.119556_18_plen_113_part_00